jgi:hypothetical protein
MSAPRTKCPATSFPRDTADLREIRDYLAGQGGRRLARYVLREITAAFPPLASLLEAANFFGELLLKQSLNYLNSIPMTVVPAPPIKSTEVPMTDVLSPQARDLARERPFPKGPSETGRIVLPRAIRVIQPLGVRLR